MFVIPRAGGESMRSHDRRTDAPTVKLVLGPRFARARGSGHDEHKVVFFSFVVIARFIRAIHQADDIEMDTPPSRGMMSRRAAGYPFTGTTR
jgi:hypothetical protein